MGCISIYRFTEILGSTQPSLDSTNVLLEVNNLVTWVYHSYFKVGVGVVTSRGDADATDAIFLVVSHILKNNTIQELNRLNTIC